MKKWEKYEQFLLDGDWHVHTDYTDGKNTIIEYCKQAEKNGLRLIAFTEHVRRKLEYNFDDFVSDVFSAKDKFDLEIVVGCEAKVLDTMGSLDVSKEVLKQCEIVIGSFHKFEPHLKEAYLAALKNMISNSNVDIWGHPMLYSIRNVIPLNDENIHKIANLCSKHNVLIEKNFKYGVPDMKFQVIASNLNCKFVYGSDAHQISDVLSLTDKRRV